MISKKMLLSLFALAGINAISLNNFADSLVEGSKELIEKKELVEKEEKNTKNLILKLIKKEPLDAQEEEFIYTCCTCSISTLGGLTFFYLTPPIGFGVVGIMFIKSFFALIGIAGGYGLVEFFKTITIDEIKEKMNSFFTKNEIKKEKI